MSRGAVAAPLVLASLLVGLGFQTAFAQSRTLDVSIGRIALDRVAAPPETSDLLGRPSNLVVSVRQTTARGSWLYGSASTPFSDEALRWGAAGAGGRFMLPDQARHRVSAGVDLATHGYVFRDALADATGTGGVLEGFAVATVAAGRARMDLRGGWRGQTLSLAGTTRRRGVVEGGGRVSIEGPLRLQAEARWVRADEEVYPFAGVSVVYGRSPVALWVQGGRWFGEDEIDGVTWTAGVGRTLGRRASFWLNVRQEAVDPLYRNAARRTWSVGVTRQLGAGRRPSVQRSLPDTDGAVVIRVALADAPTSELSIAGSFNKWQPQPMQREGQAWVVRLTLAPGVYDYAFRAADGVWFVPASVASRRDDGMGGHVALLVVP